LAIDFLEVPKLGRVNMSEKLRFSGKMLSARIADRKRPGGLWR
jgi:hypothetical protein